MNSTIFYLNDEKTDFVTVKWKDGWQNTLVYRINEKIGEIATKKDLQFGRPLLSSDRKLIFIQLKKPILGKPYLELLVDGITYDYREPSTKDKINQVFSTILIIAVANILFGLSGMFLNNYIRNLGFGFYSVVFGIIFLGLGLVFRYKKSLAAITIMAVLMIIDLAFYFIANMHSDILSLNSEAIFSRIAFILIFIRGVILVFQYKKEEKAKIGT